MLKIRKNNYIESFENGIEGVNEILFTVSDETVIKETFKDCKFKYRNIDEYIFNELEVYKLYNSNSESEDELFNIVRLLSNEIEYYKELLFASKIVFDAKIDINQFDELIYNSNSNNFDSNEILFENDTHIIFKQEYKLFVNPKKDSFNYKNQYLNNQIDCLLKGINLSDELKFKIKQCLIKNEYINLQELNIECLNINKVEEFARLATAETNVMEHSWAGRSGNSIIFELISGEIEFGIYSCYEYSNNGNIGSPQFERRIVDFNTLSEIAFLRIENKFDNYNENDINEHYYTLVIYK